LSHASIQAIELGYYKFFETRLITFVLGLICLLIVIFIGSVNEYDIRLFDYSVIRNSKLINFTYFAEAFPLINTSRSIENLLQ